MGLGPGGPQPLSATRIAGAALAVVAVAVLRLGHGGGAVSGGVVLGAPGRRRGRRRDGLGPAGAERAGAAATGEGLLAAAVNFVGGAVLLGAAFALVAGAGHGPGTPWPPALWLYAGGVLGIAYIATAIWSVGPLGVLRLGLLLVAGQLAGGVLIDLVSPGRTGPPGASTYAAVLLTLAAVRGRRQRSEQVAPGHQGQRHAHADHQVAGRQPGRGQPGQHVQHARARRRRRRRWRRAHRPPSRPPSPASGR